MVSVPSSARQDETLNKAAKRQGPGRSGGTNRAEFLGGAACALLLAATPRCDAIDWSYPGAVGAYARRLDAAAPFVQHDAGTSMPAASTIKLVIAIAVLTRMERDAIGWSYRLALRGPEIVGASESYGNARPGQLVTLAALMEAAIAQSDNTAANALADWVSFAAVDAAARAAGMHATHMRRHFMDFSARSAGIDNTTTARDMGVLAAGIARGIDGSFAGVSPAGCQRLIEIMLRQEDRETIPAAIGGARSVANKTGVLPDVRNDVAIVGLGTRDAYAVALMSSHVTDYPAAMIRLRAIAERVDAYSSPACSSRESSRLG